LIAGEERTKEVFGDYVSIYNFRQSIEDHATVPLYYENRSPEMQILDTDEFDRRMQEILEAAELDEEQEKRLAREFGREYHLITDDDRLDTVAENLVEHFIDRGHQGKAMVISIDKATAVKMYDRVQVTWNRRIEELRRSIDVSDELSRDALSHKLGELKTTDMAVVVSASQNEKAELAAKGVDIVPHRTRMVNEDLDTKFKDPDDPLRVVFVCAMWLTGFDAPATSTIYLDKPMRNHTLMQTIARANRVFQGKQAGEIIDYIGVFRNLQQALAIYGSGSGGGVEPGDLPVEPKDAQAEELAELIRGLEGYAVTHGVNIREGIDVAGFNWVEWLKNATDALLIPDDVRRGFLARADMCAAMWKSVKPHPAATDAQPVMSVIVRLAQRIRMETGKPDLSGVMDEVERLLEEALAARPFVIDPDETVRVDLTQIDFDALGTLFASGNKATAAARLQASLEQRLERMVRLNPKRIDYVEKLRDLVDRYNAGSKNIEEFFEELKRLANSLNEEQERHVREQLTEEELAVFDLLTKPDPELTPAQEISVKAVVRELVDKLKRELLVLDWRQRHSTRAAVRVGIETIHDGGLPDVYDRSLFSRKSQDVYQHVFTSYQGDGNSIYDEAA
jgi:type I restriction enzyme R subunit